ncbi:MAG TPA: dephospho-CoA kinase [Planctomycetaceae bacterium]|nr:dephospho-CoA kinase [Planctomycetaceae bacterium]
MLKVGLTGGIATGKSDVLERFRRRGVPCLDADQLAHGVTAAGTEATTAIAARFGSEVLAPDGSVDRTRLGPIVFADAAARRDLEALTHPAVYRAIAAGLRAFQILGGYPLAIVDVPLLYESGHDSDFDRIIVTTCPPATQRERLRERGLSETEVEQRLAAQWPLNEKAARADFTIRTDGTFDETDHQVANILTRLMAPG